MTLVVAVDGDRYGVRPFRPAERPGTRGDLQQFLGRARFSLALLVAGDEPAEFCSGPESATASASANSGNEDSWSEPFRMSIASRSSTTASVCGDRIVFSVSGSVLRDGVALSSGSGAGTANAAAVMSSSSASADAFGTATSACMLKTTVSATSDAQSAGKVSRKKDFIAGHKENRRASRVLAAD